MKHLILSLILLTPIALYTGDGAARADVPVAGAAAGGVAGAAAEGDAKRSEADAKSINNFPQRARQMYEGLVQQATNLAAPRPAWQDIAREITGALDVGTMIFPRDLALVITDYAQSDIGDIESIAQAILPPDRGSSWTAQTREFGMEIAEYMSEQVPDLELKFSAYKELMETHGVIFPHSREMLEKWEKCNFVFASAENLYGAMIENDRMACNDCAHAPEVVPHLNRNVRRDDTWGDVSGLCFAWTIPLLYHARDCRWATSADRTPQERAQLQHDPIPVLRTQPQEFGHYVMRHIDLYVREKCKGKVGLTGGEDNPYEHERYAPWYARIHILSYWMVGVAGFLAYAQDPEGWKERENKRAEELGSAVRYPLKKDQPK